MNKLSNFEQKNFLFWRSWEQKKKIKQLKLKGIGNVKNVFTLIRKIWIVSYATNATRKSKLCFTYSDLIKVLWNRYRKTEKQKGKEELKF